MSGYCSIPFGCYGTVSSMKDAERKSLEHIGATLREARLRAYLTQAEVGRRAGVSQHLVSRLERGCNAEIGAYMSVAATLHHQVSVLQPADIPDTELPSLDFR